MRFIGQFLLPATLLAGLQVSAVAVPKQVDKSKSLQLEDEKIVTTWSSRMALEGCLSHPPTQGGIVIDSDRQFQAMRLSEAVGECKRYGIPKIDFTKKTLIGVRVGVGTCVAKTWVAVKVVRNDPKKVYRHLTFTNGNPCRGISYRDAWVLVPKLPTGYRVEFDQINEIGLVVFPPEQDDP